MLFQGLLWEHVNSPQSLIAISTCNEVVWAVGRKGELYYRENITKENPGGSNWKLIEQPKLGYPYNHKTIGVKAVSLTNNAAWVILSNGTISVRTKISKEQQDGKEWNYFTGKFNNHVIKLYKNIKKKKYMRRILFSDTDSEMTFKHVSSVGQDVWAVCGNGTIMRRLGVTAHNVIGTTWQCMTSGSLVHVTARGRSQ